MYLGFFFYAILCAIAIDALRLGWAAIHWLPFGLPELGRLFSPGLWYALAGCVIAALCAGNWIALHPRLRTIAITIPKRAPGLDRITVAAVSDIHFGRILGQKHLEKIESLLNQARPDLILLLGDLFDEDISDQERRQMTTFLNGLSCDLGVYAVTGNHDYSSGMEKFTAALHESGICLLQDTSIAVGGAFLLVGRKDASSRRFDGGRKSLDEIIGNADRRLPMILMDHQPFHLEEAQAGGIDLQLSGHTHHGQLFPLNLLYRWIYERSWGYLRKGNTQIMVSCGVGTWGPPVRTNSIPEVLKINLTFLPAE
jgi:predicted MPP superfamily phosphohydrolase